MPKLAPSGTETPAMGATKTPKANPPPGDETLKKEYSPATQADFKTFLQQQKACALFNNHLTGQNSSLCHPPIHHLFCLGTEYAHPRLLCTHLAGMGSIAEDINRHVRVFSSTSQSTVLASKPVIWASCFMQLVDEWQGSMFVHVVQDVGYRTGFCQVRESLHFWHLKTWHEQHGPTSQLTMISDVLSIDFKRNVPLDQTIQQIHATNKAIWAMGVPSPEVFLSLLLVQSLQKNYPVLYRDIDNSIMAAMKQFPFTSDSIISCITREQADPKEPSLFSANPSSRSAEAHIAQSSRPRPKCLNTNCGKEGHTLPYCIKEGRGIAGKTVGDDTLVMRLDLQSSKRA